MEMEILNKNKDKGFTQTPLSKQSGAGFTLVELLIALFAFGMIILAIMGVSQSVIKAQRKAFALQDIQESGRYILESLSKEIRMSKIITAAGSDLATLNIINSKGQNVIYSFDNINNKLERQINGNVWEDISPTNLELTGSFYIRKTVSPTAAPRALVTVNMKIESSNQRVEQNANIYLQSSISSRSWDY